MPTVGICIEECIKIIYLFSYKKLFTTFYLMICDFSKKIMKIIQIIDLEQRIMPEAVCDSLK